MAAKLACEARRWDAWFQLALAVGTLAAAGSLAEAEDTGQAAAADPAEVGIAGRGCWLAMADRMLHKVECWEADSGHATQYVPGRMPESGR